jgi:hypothetical protein
MPYPMGSHPHLHSPCDRCGYPRAFKQFPTPCACYTPDRCPHPTVYVVNGVCRRCGGDMTTASPSGDPNEGQAMTERCRYADGTCLTHRRTP